MGVLDVIRGVFNNEGLCVKLVGVVNAELCTVGVATVTRGQCRYVSFIADITV